MPTIGETRAKWPGWLEEFRGYVAYTELNDYGQDDLPGGPYATPEEAWAEAEARYREDAGEWGQVDRGSPGSVGLLIYGVRAHWVILKTPRDVV